MTCADIEQAFAKVKAAIHIDGLELALIKELYFDTVLQFMALHFTPDAPMARALELKWNKDVEFTLKTKLMDNISIMAVTESGEIVAVNLMGSVRADAHGVYSTLGVTSPEWKTILDVGMRPEANVFKHYSVSEAVHFMALATSGKMRARGIATKLVTAGLLLGAELGYKAAMIEASSVYTQKICEKLKFDEFAVINYADQKKNGELLFKNMAPDHQALILYGKKL